MDMTTQDQNPFPSSPEPRSGNVGPLIAAVVIVVLLAAGGFYFFYTQQQQPDTSAQAAAQNETAQNDSTESIEADLNATQTSGTDQDVSSLNDAL